PAHPDPGGGHAHLLGRVGGGDLDQRGHAGVVGVGGDVPGPVPAPQHRHVLLVRERRGRCKQECPEREGAKERKQLSATHEHYLNKTVGSAPSLPTCAASVPQRRRGVPLSVMRSGPGRRSDASPPGTPSPENNCGAGGGPPPAPHAIFPAALSADRRSSSPAGRRPAPATGSSRARRDGPG